VAVRPWWSRASVVGAGVLAAAALGVWQAARVADALGFGPGAPTSGREAGSGPAGGPRRSGPGGAAAGGRVDDSPRPSPAEAASPGDPGPAGVASTAPSPEAAAGGAGGLAPGPEGEYRTEAEREAAEHLRAQMERFVSDLEFTKGNREPLQQTVVPAPAPWRPPPDAGARPPPVIEAVAPRSAPAAGGVRVVIRGRHLRVSQVMFGARPARVIGATGEAVTVEAPPGIPGPVTIAVTNDDGSWVLAGQPFTYVK
jgi:hypothetical protein